LKRADDFEIMAAHGQPDRAGNPIELPLRYQTEMIGQLIVAPRSISWTLIQPPRDRRSSISKCRCRRQWPTSAVWCMNCVRPLWMNWG
jgi:hypothetical protein